MALNEKNKQTLLAGGILGVAILVIIIYFGLTMVRPQVDKQKADIAKLETDIKKNRAELNRLKNFINDEGSRGEVIATFERISSRLPPQQDPFEVFELLRDYFEGTDVVFTYLEPGRQTSRGRYFEYPFIIRGSARYHEFGQLVNLIECNPSRLMHVNSFRLTNNDRRPSIHPMELGISTFTFQQKP